MKRGMSLFSFSETADLSNLFSFIHQAGYEGVEPILSENGYMNRKTSEKELLRIRRMAADEGLEIPSVGAWNLWENNLVSNDPSIRNQAQEIIKKQIECAAILGADTILVIPGYVGCDFASKPERVRYDAAYDRCVKAFQCLVPIANRAGITIGIENVWNRFLLSPLEVKRLIKDVNLPGLGVYFDVGNVMYIGYPSDWIEILGSDIKKIHLSDYRVSQAGLGAFVDLFAGDVDFYEVAASLKRIGYNDYVTLEMLPNYKQFPEVAIRSNKAAVDKICELMD